MKDQLVRYFEWLDKLRASGKINMWGAAPAFQAHFKTTMTEARSVCRNWRETFDAKKTPEERAALIVRTSLKGI